jgi:hypothetical protein
VLLSVTPDSGTVADSLEDHLVFQFDEVVSEQAGGGIERLIRLSPRTTELGEQVDVDWRRQAVAVRPTGGWRPNLVYQVTLLPGVTDLRNNRLDSGRTVIFTTGGPIPDTRLSGYVLNWDSHTVGAGAIIEAMLLPDSLTYVTNADSAGAYLLEALPRGTYLISGGIDANRNLRRERREPFDTIAVTVDGQLEHVFWAFVQDSMGPQVRNTEYIDSLTFRLSFNQKIEPADSVPHSIQVWALPDTTPVNLGTILTRAGYDSLGAAEQAARDSLAALIDSTTADSVAADTTADVSGVVGLPQEAAKQDTLPPSPAQLLLEQRARLSDTWFVRVLAPMLPDARFLIEATVRNVIGAEATSRMLLVVPAAAPPDST